MFYKIRSPKELEKIHYTIGAWLSPDMFRYGNSLVENPVFEEGNEGRKTMILHDLYWHPSTYRKIIKKDLKDIVYLSKEDFEELED